MYRIKYFILCIASMFLGLASRKFGDVLPELIAEYSGDILWALMIYWGFRFLLPSISKTHSMIMAAFFSYGIELSQLSQLSWLVYLRNTTLGALILGKGFLWTDLICYSTGIILGYFLDFKLINENKKIKHKL